MDYYDYDSNYRHYHVMIIKSIGTYKRNDGTTKASMYCT